jgi:hypothetical protein
MDQRDNFLAEFIRLEGRGNFASQIACAGCEEPSPEYRCRDCFGGDLYYVVFLLSTLSHPLSFYTSIGTVFSLTVFR